MKALISPIQDNLIVQVESDNNIFDIAEPFYWLSCPDYVVAYQYQYTEGQFVEYVPPAPTADQNKATAISLLQKTDWTESRVVSDPLQSNPYLANQAAFIAWRSQVRAIAVTPIDGFLDIFNQMPQEDWQNAPK